MLRAYHGPPKIVQVLKRFSQLAALGEKVKPHGPDSFVNIPLELRRTLEAVSHGLKLAQHIQEIALVLVVPSRKCSGSCRFWRAHCNRGEMPPCERPLS